MNYSNLASGVIGAILVIMVQHLIPYICYLWKKCNVVRVLKQNKPNNEYSRMSDSEIAFKLHISIRDIRRVCFESSKIKYAGSSKDKTDETKRVVYWIYHHGDTKDSKDNQIYIDML